MSVIHHPLRTAGVVIAALLVFAAGARGQQATAAPPPASHLSTIDVQGLHRLTQAQVVALSGLRLGQVVDGPTVEAAAKHLVATGLFTGVRFHYEPLGDQGEVTLVVGEEAWTMPVAFDNFVWFSDDTLRAAVAAALPTFDGTAPNTNGAVVAIAHALERLLKDKNLPGRIDYELAEDLVGRGHHHQFAVRGVSLPICALRFPHASGVPESDLVKTLGFLIGSEYSRAVAMRSAHGDGVALFRQRGYLRAAFGAPQAALAATAECPTGVVMSIPVTEGGAYTWDHAEWIGQSALTAKELDDALNMKTAEPADGVRFDKGLEAVKDAYGRRGYLEMALTGVPVFDDANRRVSYRMTLKEGPPYRMGTLEATGLTPTEAARLEKVWPIPSGAAYDTTRLDEFLKKATADHLLPNGTMVTIQTKLDSANFTVDVVLVVK